MCIVFTLYSYCIKPPGIPEAKIKKFHAVE